MPRFEIQSFQAWIGRPLGSAFLTSFQKLWASPARKSLFQKTRRKRSSGVPGKFPALNKIVVFCLAGLRTALRATCFTSENRQFDLSFNPYGKGRICKLREKDGLLV